MLCSPLRRVSRLAALVALSLALPRAAAAQAVVGDTEAHRQRFFARGVLGVGYGSFTTTSGGHTLRLHGAGAMGHFAVGVGLVRNLAVHLNASAMSLVSPARTVDATTRAVMNSSDSTSTTSIIGVGLTYYLMPWNLSISASAGVAILAVEIPDYGLTQLGWGLNALVGKEWRIAYNWQIGVAAQMILSLVPDQPYMGETPTWTSIGAGVAFTITDY